ncbi:MAG: DUF2272 domain-containing protein [Clostridia bacterium]|nr:DUF2272 domain-containing protein [Clostridia bacterium]
MKQSVVIKKSMCLLLSLLLTATAFLPCAGLAPAAKAAYTVSEAYRNSPFYDALQEVELTGDARTDLLNVARSQLGYIEGGEAGDFGGSGFTGVRDNYTEYVYWYFGDETAHGDNYAWCAAFVSWCANKAGISEDTVPKFARVQSEGQATFKSWDRFRPGTYTPAPGDLIFYSGHVGIVESADGEVITSIEGNYQDRVMKRTNYCGSKAILGYGVLSDEPAPWPAYLEYPGTLQRVGSDGLVVRWLQRTLNDLGCDCGNPDGIFGNNTKNAVARFQSANGLSADGIAGEATWNMLWEKLHEKYPDAHLFRITVTPPKCTEGGYTTHACMLCRYAYADQETDPLGHTDTDGDGVCDVCRENMETQSEPQPDCVCGENHTGPFAALIRFFHKILYFFRDLFGKN